MDLDQLRHNWNQFGEDDPLWAVLTSPDKRHGAWDLDEFLATADHELTTVFDFLETVVPGGVAAMPTGRALDLGCGVGRLTLGLAGRYERCDGVDIAPSMIAEARRIAADRPAGERCTFHLVEGEDLGLFPDATFDFIYTAHVLQHMEPRFASAYVKEFVRVLRPGGFAVFQLPTGPAEVLAEPMPAEEFIASGQAVDVPSAVRPGNPFSVAVRFTNTGSSEWPAFSSTGQNHVELRYRWISDRDQVEPVGGALSIGQDIPPGGATETTLQLSAPPGSGNWVIRFWIVQVGVHESDAAERSLSVPLRVHLPWWRAIVRKARSALPRSTMGPAPEEPAAAELVMEMHASSREEVASWVAEAGGEVTAVADWCALFDQRPTDWARHLFVAQRQ